MIVERATIRLDLTIYCTHIGMGHSPEAGYNLEEAHHTGGKPVLEDIACRGRILQYGLRRREYRNLRDTEVSNRIRYNADIVAIKRSYTASMKILPST